MDKDWIQERIDELYLLEKQSTDRLGRLEVHYEKRMESLKSQTTAMNALAIQQQDSLARLDKRLGDVHGWYEKVVKFGSIVASAIVFGLVVIFFTWWHVSGLMDENQSIKDYIINQVRLLPSMVQQDGHQYVRVVEGSVSQLRDNRYKLLEGSYARVYMPLANRAD